MSEGGGGGGEGTLISLSLGVRNIHFHMISLSQALRHFRIFCITSLSRQEGDFSR